ncbi:MAG: hypothetical protein C0498_01105 [Anaerolinea sp.]|nr:hypothetical protein [Anaerolinea sp.]
MRGASAPPVLDGLKVAVAQVGARVGDVAANLALARRYLRRAAGRGADLVVFPECFLQGYTVRRDGLATAGAADDQSASALRALAARHRCRRVHRGEPHQPRPAVQLGTRHRTRRAARRGLSEDPPLRGRAQCVHSGRRVPGLRAPVPGRPAAAACRRRDLRRHRVPRGGSAPRPRWSTAHRRPVGRHGAVPRTTGGKPREPGDREQRLRCACKHGRPPANRDVLRRERDRWAGREPRLGRIRAVAARHRRALRRRGRGLRGGAESYLRGRRPDTYARLLELRPPAPGGRWPGTRDGC